MSLPEPQQPNTQSAPRPSLFAVAKSAVKTDSKRIDSLLGSDAHLEGDISFAGGLRLDGQITGHVRMAPSRPGTLVVGEHGRIDGDVTVVNLVIYGQIHGTVSATGLVELHPTAQLKGDLHYGAIEMRPGAVIEGQLFKLPDAPA